MENELTKKDPDSIEETLHNLIIKFQMQLIHFNNHI